MRVVIISNNPLSYSEANGRTMLNLLCRFKPKDILNIYVNNKAVAINEAIFYRINEHKLINVFQKAYGEYTLNNEYFDSQTITPSRKKYGVFKRLLRSLIWKNPKLNKEILNLVSDFKPGAIIIQTGDSNFLLDLSVKIAKKTKTKLYSFNSEDYPFKKWNYISKQNKENCLFRTFKKRLLKSYDSLFDTSSCAFYLTNDLYNLFLQRYPNHVGKVIYNSARKVDEKPLKNNDIVYLGNIEVGRANVLVIISELFYKMYNTKLKVYTSSNNPESVNTIKSCKTIELLGSVSYLENLKIIQNARFVVHVESFDSFYLKDTMYSFSTKIPDSLISGTPLILLSPKTTSSYKYLLSNHCAIVSDNINDLENQLHTMTDLKINEILNNAKIICDLNHNLQLNSEIFYRTIAKNE